MLEPELQPLIASAVRAVRKLGELGDPLPAGVLASLQGLEAGSSSDYEKRREIEALLQPFVLMEAEIDGEGLCSCMPGDAAPILAQHGWRSFLVRVKNRHNVQASLVEMTPGVIGLLDYTTSAARTTLPDALTIAPRVKEAWLATKVAGPLEFSGLEIEYKVISLYSRESGNRTSRLQIAAHELPEIMPQPADLLAKRRMWRAGRILGADIEFNCLPAQEVRLNVREPNGDSCMAAITLRDHQGRSYPSRAMRLAPDMYFHDHVYRATGETVHLPAGQYQVSAARGPEYREIRAAVEIGASSSDISIVLDRWIDPSSRGYYSGDPHLHAGGCSHYSVPTEGVTPETMIRHVRGEGLWLGSVLTWGPCYYYQKQFFSGESISPQASLEHPELQEAHGATWVPQGTDRDGESMLRYDIEVSGFPSSHSGHAILLGLTDQDYPGAAILEDWPSWNLPVMRWAKSQNAMVGYAHCGVGLSVGTEDLPNYIIPAFDSVGSNEIVVDVPLGAADFQCGTQYAPAAELNIWYHLLSVGYRTLMLGETDYPCIYDERPGIGRTYVRLPEPPHGPRALEAWTTGLKERESYFGDGRSHIFDFAVGGDGSREQKLDAPGTVQVGGTVAAWLPEQQPEPRSGGPAYSAPMGWHLERARIGTSRNVLLELVVNGIAVASQEMVADGVEREITFDVTLERSSWIAMRIQRSVHTQPIFVAVEGKPVRSSRRSAQWLHDCVDSLWNAKSGFIRETERAAARDAYDSAQAEYLSRRDECEVE